MGDEAVTGRGQAGGRWEKGGGRGETGGGQAGGSGRRAEGRGRQAGGSPAARSAPAAEKRADPGGLSGARGHGQPRAGVLSRALATGRAATSRTPGRGVLCFILVCAKQGARW